MAFSFPIDCKSPEEQEIILQKIKETSNVLKGVWGKYDRYQVNKKDRYVLVDLTVETWDSILTRLMIGKYISWQYNAKLCGVLISSRHVQHFIKEICEAFGCTVYIGLAEICTDAHAKMPSFAADVQALIAGWPTEGPGLRDKVAGLEFEGLPVGDLVYDSYLRGTGSPTIERLDEALVSRIADGLLRFRVYRDLFDRYDVAAVISAHVVYNYFGMLTRVALSRNVTVTQDLGINPIRLKKMDHFSTARLPLDHFSPSEFDSVFRYERSEALEFANAYMERRIGGRQDLGYQDAVHGAYGSTRRLCTREDICRDLGWDVDKPIVTIMSHVFFESPHSIPDTLYHDIHQWLKETLEIAARNPHIQWLLKPHPDHKYFNENLSQSPLLVTGEEAIQRLLEPHADRPNIGLCPNDLNTASVMGFSKAIVTNYSSAGYEFASQGIPVVIASRAPYARLGFTIEPRTREEYESVLGNLHAAAPLTDEQRERALTYAYLFLCKSRCASTLLPPLNRFGFWAPSYDAGLLDSIVERARSFDPDQDPLNEAIRNMIRFGTTTLNMRVW